MLSLRPYLQRFARPLVWAGACLGVVFSSSAAAYYADATSTTPGTLRDRLHLGGSLADGRHTTKDRVGLWMHTLACRAGDARGCTNVARIYQHGRGVPADPARAVMLLSQACTAGDGLGCSDLGLFYAWGTGVTQDATRAVTLYARSCSLRDEGGCYDLGHCFEHGFGVPVDVPRALELYALACEGGDARACFALGERSEEGTAGDLPSRDAAADYYAQACSSAHDEACTALRRLNRER